MMKARATTSKKTTKVQTARGRYDELKQILEERRREILAQVQEKMRDVRAEGGIAQIVRSVRELEYTLERK